MKRPSIRVKVYFMGFVYILIYLCYYLLYCDYTTTLASITPKARSSGSIGHKNFSQKKKIILMNGEGQGF